MKFAVVVLCLAMVVSLNIVLGTEVRGGQGWHKDIPIYACETAEDCSANVESATYCNAETKQCECDNYGHSRDQFNPETKKCERDYYATFAYRCVPVGYTDKYTNKTCDASRNLICHDGVCTCKRGVGRGIDYYIEHLTCLPKVD